LPHGKHAQARAAHDLGHPECRAQQRVRHLGTPQYDKDDIGHGNGPLLSTSHEQRQIRMSEHVTRHAAKNETAHRMDEGADH
jgi:hypothetical protein